MPNLFSIFAIAFGFLIGCASQQQEAWRTQPVIAPPSKAEPAVKTTDSWSFSSTYCPDSIYSKYLVNAYKHQNQNKHKKAKQSRRARRRLQQAAEYNTHKKLNRIAPHVNREMPLKSNSSAMPWIKYFNSKKGKKEFIRWLVRGENQKGYIKPILKELGMPKELVFLAMIESGFKNSAYSKARATGTWQFISPTAKAYGLQVGYWVDERRSVTKSSHAASRYLLHLYQKFNNWNLTLAAYNTGPGRIIRAIRKGGTRSYWQLTKRRALHRETRNYIPKMTAAYVLTMHAKNYGFNVHNPPEIIELSTVQIPHSIRLQEVANKINIKLKNLRTLNPEYYRNVIPKSKKGAQLKIPKQHYPIFLSQQKNLEGVIIHDIKFHTLKPGDTLHSLAKIYKTSIKSIIATNPNIAPRYLKIGRKVAIPVPNAVSDKRNEANF